MVGLQGQQNSGSLVTQRSRKCTSRLVATLFFLEVGRKKGGAVQYLPEPILTLGSTSGICTLMLLVYYILYRFYKCYICLQYSYQEVVELTVRQAKTHFDKTLKRSVMQLTKQMP